MADTSSVQVRRDAQRGQFELLVDGQPAGLIRFRQDGDVLDLLHTEVDPRLGGQGLGSQLVAQALAEVRRAGQKVVPSCSFVAAWLERHPDQADLVEP